MSDSITITTKENSTVEISGELPTDSLAKHEERALKHLGKEVALPGFRKGKVPTAELKKHVPEQQLWQEMAERAIAEFYPAFLIEKEIKAIGRPHITITKLAPNNPLGFTITTAILPEVTLPDYKKLAAAQDAPKEVTVTNEDIENAIKEIQTRAQQAEQQTKKQAGDENIVVPLPELTDEFVARLGPYKDVAHFKESLRAELRTHKHRLERDKHRIGTLEAIMAETKVEVPDLLVDAELGKLLAQFKQDVARVGMQFDDYLKQIKKSEDDLRKEWRADAQKRAKSQLVLNKIAATERITPDEKAVAQEVDKIITQQKSADPKFDENAHKDSIRIYVSTLLMNERVFEFLESQATKTESK